MSEPTDVLTAALDYARRGWAVFPVKGKLPALDLVPHWSKDSSTDPKVIVDWFAGTSGLGVAVDLNKSRLCVVDGDHLEHLTFRSKLTGWTYHGNRARLSWLYTLNGHGIPQAKHPWGEVKAAGGYVVLPPSPHPDFPVLYEWVPRPPDVDAVPPSIPAEVEALIAPVAQDEAPGSTWAGGTASDWEVGEARRRMSLACQRVAEETLGARNMALNIAAVIVGHYVPHYIARAEAEKALMAAAERCGLVRDDGRRQCWATITSGLSKGQSEPQSTEVHVTLLDVDPMVDATAGLLLPESFWDTPVLAAVRQAAHAAQLGAAGVLGACLARTSMLTNVAIELPHTRNRGSLNLYVALVVGSGGGKGSSVEIAGMLLPVKEMSCYCGDHDEGDFITISPGSGEGMTRSYWELVKEGRGRKWRRDRAHLLLDVDEIETLIAITGRQGATIGPVLRSMWSGAQAGFHNASADRRFPLRPGTYRVAMVAGVQPQVVGKLFDESMGGTPQRILWLPAHAKDIPNLEAGEVLPTMPAPLVSPQLEARGKPWSSLGGVGVDAEIQREMDLRRNRIGRGVEKIDVLDAHRDFLRLKVAALLARMHVEEQVTAQWWGKAGMVMNLSDATRAAMLRVVAGQETEKVRSAGARDHIRRTVVVEMDAERVERAGKVMAAAVGRHVAEKRHAPEHPGSCWKRCAMNAPGGRYSREERAQALELAVERDWLAEAGDRLTPGSSRPA